VWVPSELHAAYGDHPVALVVFLHAAIR